jgi:hypothetical protein
MKLIFILATLFASHAAFAGAQQDKMKNCNLQAKGKKGDERKAFMKDCLSSKPAADAPAGANSPSSTASEADAQIPAAKSADPKQRMKDCNVQGKGKKGDERKAFMSSCLKN